MKAPTSLRSILHLPLAATGTSASSLSFRFSGFSVSVSMNFKLPKLSDFTDLTEKTPEHNWWPGCGPLKLIASQYIVGCCRSPTCSVNGLNLDLCVCVDRETGNLAKQPLGMFTRNCHVCSLQDGTKLECKGKLTSIDLNQAGVLEVDTFGTLTCSNSY